MPYTFPIGVANSVSSNFGFDPIDTIEYAQNGRFEILQIYLNQQVLDDPAVLDRILKDSHQFSKVYYHGEGYLNDEFPGSDYQKKLYAFLERTEAPSFILHFDEKTNIDVLIRVVEKLGKQKPAILVENFFREKGKEAAEKNLKKFLALFTLSTNFGTPIYPVLDIPRLFHRDLEMETGESLEWCYQVLNFFGNRRIPILLHLIDAQDNEQSRNSFVELGKGVLPYDEIFRFILKTRPTIAGAILEFEDKVHPISSRDYLKALLEA
ncbi:MAG: hypothetical protein KDI06_03380 [Calditrichaeota bacterium]|nr:hypothetical protein [Calditrichota bacterium]HQU72686.1 hypothetical protein [Calditrichia bacterium]